MAKLAVMVLLAHFVLIAAFLFSAAPPKPIEKPEPVIALRVVPLTGQASKNAASPAALQPIVNKSLPAARKEMSQPNISAASFPDSPSAVQEPLKHDGRAFSAQAVSEPDFKAAYLNNPKPPYPRMAIRQQIQGTVTLLVRVLPDGSPGDIRIDQSSGNSLLDDSALKTVKSWRFVPARQGGLPVTAEVKVPIVFSLQ